MGFPRRAYVGMKYMKDAGVSNKQMKNTKTYNHLRYIAMRSRESKDEERGLFGPEKDHESIKAFYRNIEKDPALKHKNAVKLHKIVISFRGEDFRRYGIDMKEMTRDFMKSLEERKGLKLDWVAACHMKSEQPHVHIAIKSVGIDKDGRTRRLKLDFPPKGKKPDRLDQPDKEDNDWSWARGEVDRYTGRDNIVAQEKAFRQMQRENAKAFRETAREIFRDMEQVRRESERENERAQRRFLYRAAREARYQKGQYRSPDRNRGDKDRGGR